MMVEDGRERTLLASLASPTTTTTKHTPFYCSSRTRAPHQQQQQKRRCYQHHHHHDQQQQQHHQQTTTEWSALSLHEHTWSSPRCDTANFSVPQSSSSKKVDRDCAECANKITTTQCRQSFRRRERTRKCTLNLDKSTAAEAGAHYQAPASGGRNS